MLPTTFLHKEKAMEYVLAVYRSRNMTIRAYNFLQNNGVTCALVSTPRAAGVGCGLSVKIARADFPRVRDALVGESFVGFFLFRNSYSGGTLTRL